VTAVQSRVTRWEDQSSNHVAAVGSRALPLRVSGAANGHPAIEFSGHASLAFQLPVNGLSGMTIFLVASASQNAPDAAPPFPAALSWSASAFGGATFVAPYEDSVAFEFGAAPDNPARVVPRTASIGRAFSLTEVVKQGTEETLAVNGSTAMSLIGGSSGLDGVAPPARIGETALPRGRSVCYSGRIAEILVYDRALTPAERWIADGYLIQKYGLR